MKLTVENGVLQAALVHASRIVERRNTIPILANVLLTAEDGRLALRTTDLDLEVSLSVAAEVQAKGAITVPAALLTDIVKKCAGQSHTSLEYDAKSGKLAVRNGRSRFTLHTLPKDDFPALEIDPTQQSNCRFNVPAKQLRRLFGKVQFAISTEETRYYLNGVFMQPVMANGVQSHEGNPGTLRGVATDGHRLAMVDVPMPEGAQAIPGNGVIVPRKVVGEILKLLDKQKDDDQIAISFGGTSLRMQVEIGDIKLVSKLIDGTFPDYQRVIPNGNDKIAKFDRDEFMSAVDRVVTVSSERGRAARLDFTKGRLKLSVHNPDAGHAEEEAEIDYNGDPLTIGFNSRYVGEILSHIDGDEAEMNLADAGSPTIFKGADVKDALYVLMPMRVT